MSGRTTPVVSVVPPALVQTGASGADVSLTTPRPDRTQNVYVETPLRPQPSFQHRLAPVHRSSVKRTAVISPTPPPTIITKQPSKISQAPPDDDACAAKSIICQKCGQCRCEACRRPRTLPSVWLCDGACLCSATELVNYATCMCCVKALFYHCSRDHEEDREGTDCADKPCSCAPHRRCARWGCMALMSAFLPCLCCYWPLRTCVKGVERLHQRVNNNGCRCNELSNRSDDKRLLDSTSDT